MELPKNITQIGEVGKDCKVYAEDYVVSYLKQLNQTARDKEVAAALYGRRREEDGTTYFFLYGACQLTLLQRETRHLSQAQYQEIERLRRKYFPEYAFLGYRLLDGEMIEGFHICEQEICRYIAGYAQFYEKNDPMLTYMLEVRREIEPEIVDQEKYNEVKRRQEERRAATEGQAKAGWREEGDDRRGFARGHFAQASGNRQWMKLAAAGVIVLLCLFGFAALQRNPEREADLQASAKQWVDGLMQQQLPDNGEAVATSGGAAQAQKDVLVMEDKLEQALKEENQTNAQPGETPGAAGEDSASGQGDADEGPSGTGEANGAGNNTLQEGASGSPGGTGNAGEPGDTAAQTGAENGADASDGAQAAGGSAPAETVPVSGSGTEAVAYVIQTGDTLIGISRRQYGNETRVSDICRINSISNPDDIKVGQVIMLPK